MYYLRRYVEKTPGAKARLLAAFKKEARRPLDKSTLWRQLALRVEPPGSMVLFYLSWLHREGAIHPGNNGSLFEYALPDLLKAEKK